MNRDPIGIRRRNGGNTREMRNLLSIRKIEVWVHTDRMDKAEPIQIGITPDQQMTEGQRETIRSAKGSMAGLIPPSSSARPDRDDAEMLFRCGMQFLRYLAKKYDFTIKQWPEK